MTIAARGLLVDTCCVLGWGDNRACAICASFDCWVLTALMGAVIPVMAGWPGLLYQGAPFHDGVREIVLAVVKIDTVRGSVPLEGTRS